MSTIENRNLILLSLGTLLMVTGGSIYRQTHTGKHLPGTTKPKDTLNGMIPWDIGDWHGEEIDLIDFQDPDFFADTAFLRRYRNPEKNRYADLYIAETKIPAAMLGHRPDVCYVAGGWVLDETKSLNVETTTGTAIPCSLSVFHNPSDLQRKVVLNFYIYEGDIYRNETAFRGLKWRLDSNRTKSDASLAQIQISSQYESVALEYLQLMGDVLIDIL
ncbi:hypothetical protein STSP2_02637 [Anaerohalosphaera lusitana]|uniref:Methanolan biosynthesis EpsI domain-containing protein n=1 Tax=Anaerohalosphaera lusitana TaxID=1936003 RepID=A0A1U9NNS5_9BACT|nr:exosortase-associated EpsI family protein [Anaerohalosphaera lusitana]AQT69447.1 hypothetical protein STSP2_02637 [Anaerohalosphaera lusitana]